MITTVSSLESLESRIAPAVFLVTTVADISDPVHHASGSLRDALANADAHAGADVIKFHLPAPPAHGENIIALDKNLGELTSNGDVTIQGTGAGKLIIDGGGNSRVFHISDVNDPTHTSAHPTTISGVSIINGHVDSPYAGGGILSDESLTLKNVVVAGNSASGGGGVSVDKPGTAKLTVSVIDSFITGNIATGFGSAGMDISGADSLTIKSSTISGNSGSADGGGMYANFSSNAAVTIAKSTISGNTAREGGGLFLTDNNTPPTSTIKISSTKFSANTAKSYGGGLKVTGFGSLTISKSTISGNKTTDDTHPYEGGAGIYITQGVSGTFNPAKISNSMIVGNQSAGLGGGLSSTYGVALTISNSTFLANSAVANGGAIDTFGTGLAKVNLTVTGGTFTDNSAIIGGGIATSGDGVVSITGSKITGNLATGNNGGGIAASSTDSVTIKNVIATGNVAANIGGGLFILDTPNFQVSGGSFTGNVALRGGGIYAYTSTGSIKGVTISGNVATQKGGGVFTGSLQPGIVTLQIAKVIANTAPLGPDVADSPGDLSTFTFV